MSRFLFPIDVVPPIGVLDCELAAGRLRAVIERPVMRQVPTPVERPWRGQPDDGPAVIEIGGGAVERVEEDAERWDGLS